MTTLLEQAFQAAQQLPGELQDEIAQQLLDDIANEQKWQAAFANPEADLGGFEAMAAAALVEDEQGDTEAGGFGEA